MDKTINEVNSIFQQPWWLDVVAPGQWDEVLVKQGDEVVARMPYIIKNKFGLNIVTMPPLTQTLGPWLRPSNAKYAKKLSEQKNLMNELIDKLPKLDCFCQNFSPQITNWLPFYWAGFHQTMRYTYRINDLSDHEKVWKGFMQNIRTDIRKAKKIVKVRSDLELDKFFKINALTFERQGMKLPYTYEFVKCLDTACMTHNSRKIFFAEDARGRIHATIYIVWDSNTVYYLMGGGDPELRNSGATSFLVWEVIKFASTVSRAFDFEGSMIEPVERFFRSFGAIQTPYYQITKMSRKMRIAYHGKQFIKDIVN
ncbi:MAG: GNAT family N-acetyltransferase [Clostridiales bacterium]|nr:GNAT family N-acetyltransferase [Clostridiales bacterium]MCF8022797.1 GNAT family N-acetyltransferase [Clostridiales bacterium]